MPPRSSSRFASITSARPWADRGRALLDRGSGALAAGAAASALLIVFAITVALVVKAWPVLSQESLPEILLSSSLRPDRGDFGFASFIVGTLWVTGLAMVFSIPVSLLTAIYLAEYAPPRVRASAKPLLDLLAGIPPVVYGLCGVLAVVPIVSWLGDRCGVMTTGYSVLAGGIILAIMVFPITISVCEEVLRSVPRAAREASLALGATRWQMVKGVLVRAVYPGLSAGLVLGFSRAFGETMAVLMVVGNVPQAPHSLFDAAYPLPALIANKYGEMMSIPRYDAALLLAALLLLVVVLGFNLASRMVIRRVHASLGAVG